MEVDILLGINLERMVHDREVKLPKKLIIGAVCAAIGLAIGFYAGRVYEDSQNYSNKSNVNSSIRYEISQR